MLPITVKVTNLHTEWPRTNEGEHDEGVH